MLFNVANTILIFFIESDLYAWFPLLILIIENICRFCFSWGFKDLIHLESLHFYIINSRSFIEALRFNCLCRLVQQKNSTIIVVNVFQNFVILMVDHSELIFKLYRRLEWDVPKYYIWLPRFERSFTHLYLYALPVLYTVLALSILLGSQMKNLIVYQYLEVLVLISFWHFLQQFLNETGFYILRRYNKNERLDFLNGIQPKKVKLCYVIMGASFFSITSVKFFINGELL